MQRMDLEQLVNAAVENDKQAFTQLYEISSSKAYFAALCVTKNEKDAVNIMQTAYLLMRSRLERLKYPQMFENWFYRIACKCIYDYIIKTNSALFDSFNMLNVEDFNDELQIGEYSQDLFQFTQNDKITATKILEHLPTDKRLCFLMYYYFKMSIDEISKILSVDEKIIALFLNESKKIVKVNMTDSLERQNRPTDIPIIAFYNFALCNCSSHIPFTATDMIIGNIFKTNQTSVPVGKPKNPVPQRPVPNQDSESTQMYSSEEMTEYLNQTQSSQSQTPKQQNFNNQYKNQYKKEYSKGGAQDDAIPAAEPVSKIVKIVLAVIIALIFIVALFSMVKNIAKNNEDETTTIAEVTTEESTTLQQYIVTTAPTTQSQTTTTTTVVETTTEITETEPETEPEEPVEEPEEPTDEVIE